MALKYFKEENNYATDATDSITLNEHIFSIEKTKDGVDIIEECDRYFYKSYTKKQAIELFEEAIAWIKLNI